MENVSEWNAHVALDDSKHRPIEDLQYTGRQSSDPGLHHFQSVPCLPRLHYVHRHSDYA